MSDDWSDWWRRRGDDRLSLLLWAVWNPIGPVPLDEYEDYTGQVVSVLDRGHKADLERLPRGATETSDVQDQRNKIRAESLDELATLLGDLRQRQMGMHADSDADRRAADTLLDWYEWEMERLG